MHAAATEARSAALRTLLRSFGQVVLQANAVTGACLLAAWLLFDPRLACAALIGAVSANVSALLAGSAEDDTRDGLHGFNGALAGLAAFTFIADDATAIAVTILAATGTAWLLQVLLRPLRTRGLGYFSSPCLLVTWIWLPWLASPVGGGHAGSLLDATQRSGMARVSAGWLAGLAQTGFASGALAGALVLIGIAASSRRHALWALLGAALSSAALGFFNAPASSFDAGLLGYNGALTALALADGGALTTLAGIAISVALQALGMRSGWPVMTAPFVIGTWVVQWYRGRCWSGGADTFCVQRRDRSTSAGGLPVSSNRADR